MNAKLGDVHYLILATFVHAFEVEAGTALSRRSCCRWFGLAFDLSVNLGTCADDAARCKDHLRAVGLPTRQNDLLLEKFLTGSATKHDKKCVRVK